jgi:hypothetical protein
LTEPWLFKIAHFEHSVIRAGSSRGLLDLLPRFALNWHSVSQISSRWL